MRFTERNSLPIYESDEAPALSLQYNEAMRVLDAAALIGVDGTLSPDLIEDGSITEPKLADGAASTRVLAAGSVTGRAIAPNAVTSGAIAANSVGSRHLLPGSVEEPKLAAGAVTSGKLAANAVTVDKISDGSVTTPKIADGAVTSSKLASGVIPDQPNVIEIENGVMTKNGAAVEGFEVQPTNETHYIKVGVASDESATVYASGNGSLIVGSNAKGGYVGTAEHELVEINGISVSDFVNPSNMVRYYGENLHAGADNAVVGSVDFIGGGGLTRASVTAGASTSKISVDYSPSNEMTHEGCSLYVGSTGAGLGRGTKTDSLKFINGQTLDEFVQAHMGASSNTRQPDTQTGTVVDTFKMTATDIPVWTGGGTVNKVRMGWFSLHSEGRVVDIPRNTAFLTNLDLSAGSTFTCVLVPSGVTTSPGFDRYTFKVSETGKSITCTTDIRINVDGDMLFMTPDQE